MRVSVTACGSNNTLYCFMLDQTLLISADQAIADPMTNYRRSSTFHKYLLK